MDKLSEICKKKRQANIVSKRCVGVRKSEQGVQHKRKLPMDLVMLIMKKDAIADSIGHHGNFECMECRKYYSLSFGVYGKRVENFSESGMVCRECVYELGSKFRRM